MYVCNTYISITKLHRVVSFRKRALSICISQMSPTHLQKSAMSLHSAVSIRNTDERYGTGNRVLPQTSPVYLQHISGCLQRGMCICNRYAQVVAGYHVLRYRRCYVCTAWDAACCLQRVAACCSVFHIEFSVYVCLFARAHVRRLQKTSAAGRRVVICIYVYLDTYMYAYIYVYVYR